MTNFVKEIEVEQVVKPRRIQRGISTSDVVCSAHITTNDEVFLKILSLYAQSGDKIADVTHGKGVFWRKN